MPLLKGIQIHMVKSKYGMLKMILCMLSLEIEYQNRIGPLQNLVISLADTTKERLTGWHELIQITKQFECLRAKPS